MSELVLIPAAFFLGMGLFAIVWPAGVARLFGTTGLTVAGRSEVRAVYGGFGVAVALVLAWSQRRPDLEAGIVVTVALSLAGMALGRLVSFVIDRKIGIVPVTFFVVEVLLAALLLVAAGRRWRRLKGSALRLGRGAAGCRATWCTAERAVERPCAAGPSGPLGTSLNGLIPLLSTLISSA